MKFACSSSNLFNILRERVCVCLISRLLVTYIHTYVYTTHIDRRIGTHVHAFGHNKLIQCEKIYKTNDQTNGNNNNNNKTTPERQ